MTRPTIDEVIRILGLQPLPREGGLFSETYRSAIVLAPNALPREYRGARSLSTAIYYMITPERYSALHRVHGDEVFHFYLGDPAEMLLLRGDGTGEVLTLGTDLAAGMRPQVVVPGGVWQGSRLRDGGAFALLGTTMAPGFDPGDFELGDRPALVTRFPSFAREIERLTAR
jgi:predicted cupin superfamily sugar epimerase